LSQNISSKSKKVSIVIPAYNEEENIAKMHNKLTDIFSNIPSYDYEVIFVNDGSSDETLDAIKDVCEKDNHIKCISFSKNFGHEAASSAGLHHAKGDAVVLIDADLQDPPELIPELIEKWENGFDAVLCKRRSREGESFFKKLTSKIYYRLMNIFIDFNMVKDVGDFRLIDRKVCNEFNKMDEHSIFVRGMLSWVGFNTTVVEFDRKARKSGTTKYNLWNLISLSMKSLIAFSSFPLHFTSVFGLFTAVISIISLVVILIQKLFFGTLIGGSTLILTSVFFFGGVQLFSLGILAEYIGNIYKEVQNRQKYIIEEKIGV